MFTVLRASTLRRQQVADMRAMDRRLLTDHERLAQGIGLLISQAATGTGLVPNTRARREALSQGAWERVLKPYYVGQGEPLRGSQPQSPYAAVLVAGVTSAVKLQVEWHTAMLRRYIRNERVRPEHAERVLAWLTGPRPLPRVNETLQESFAAWLDPRGFKLADRIQRMAVEIKARMSRFFDYHIGKGTPAPTMAQAAGQFLTTGETARRPYGPQGSYPARFLVRNEMIVAGGSATQNLSQVNPIVRGIKWQLNRADVDRDRCDANAKGGPDGDGVYSFELLPTYPDHPGEQCSLFPVAVAKPAEITGALLAGIEQGDEYTAALKGMFNDQWVTDALKSGAFEGAAERVIAAKPATPLVVPAPKVATVPTLSAVARAEAAIDLAHRPGEAQLTAVARHIDEQIADVAKAYGVTPLEVERSITEAFAKLTAENRMAIQFPSQHIDSLLTDGRFKTQFETEQGGGITNTTYRANAEQRGIGAPLDLDPKVRSVYAFLDVGAGARANVRDYGDITFIFKEETKARATVTVGDSLFNFSQREVAGTPVLSPTRHSWDTAVEALYDYATGGTASELTGQVRYIEAQIQRGASLSDVRAVVDRGALSAAQRTALRDLGIEIWDN